MDWRSLAGLTGKNIEKSCAVIEGEEKVIPGAVSIKYFPMAIEKAQGSLVWDADGNTYIDFLTSAAAYNAGHCHRRWSRPSRSKWNVSRITRWSISTTTGRSGWPNS